MFEVTFDDTVRMVRTIGELWTALHLDHGQYVGCCAGIIMKLPVFGEPDISPAYGSHTVRIRIVGGE